MSKKVNGSEVDRNKINGQKISFKLVLRTKVNVLLYRSWNDKSKD